VDSSGGDQMSIAHTKTHFSDTVAKEMERLGFHSEASFCYDMSCYMKACDDRGAHQTTEWG